MVKYESKWICAYLQQKMKLHYLIRKIEYFTTNSPEGEKGLAFLYRIPKYPILPAALVLFIGSRSQ